VIERVTALGLARTPGYAHAAVASGERLVLTAGAVPLDAAGNLVGPRDCAAQTRQVLDNLGRALEAAGAGWEGVLKTTVYVATDNRADLAAVWDVVQDSPAAPAASTLLGVSLLGYEGQLVEIEAVAVPERPNATDR
jgi:enamine deaminase RidA (YjgF/YER057c/UK114 family)